MFYRYLVQFWLLTQKLENEIKLVAYFSILQEESRITKIDPKIIGNSVLV